MSAATTAWYASVYSHASITPWHLGNRPSLRLRDCEYVVLVPLLVVVDARLVS